MKKLILLGCALALSGCSTQFGTRVAPTHHAAPHAHPAPAAAVPEAAPVMIPAAPPAAVPVPPPPAKKARLFDRIKSHLHRKQGDAK